MKHIYPIIFICLFMFINTASAIPISNSSIVSILDCEGNTVNLGKLAVKSEAREKMVGYQSTTVAGFRLDVENLPDCCDELNFINVAMQDSSPPSWKDENNNQHDLSIPYIDPPWNWDPGNVPKADNKPFYDGQRRNKKASETGGIAGHEFALDDLLKTETDADPILSLVFGDIPHFSDSIKFATLLTCIDETAKEISVIKSFTWGATITGEGLGTLPIVISNGLPSGLNRNIFQSALDKTGFGSDIKDASDKLQHKGEGWKVTIATDCDPCRPIPEPSTILLFGIGLFGIFGLKKKA